MPNREAHNKECTAHGISFHICDPVNRYMDEPSQEHPGCSHRNLRHGASDCDKIAHIVCHGNNPQSHNLITTCETEVKKACNIHRQLDKQEESCGCKSLFE